MLALPVVHLGLLLEGPRKFTTRSEIRQRTQPEGGYGAEAVNLDGIGNVSCRPMSLREARDALRRRLLWEARFDGQSNGGVFFNSVPIVRLKSVS